MSLRAQTLQQFHVELSAKRPTPGGGAVAALTGATAASLAHMVVAYSFTKSLARHEAALRDAGERLARARDLLLTLADEDAAAYKALSDAFKIPKDDPARRETLPLAALAATQVPLAVMAACCDVLRLAATLPDRSNRNLRSDLVIAAMLAETGCRAGAENVRINLPILAEYGKGTGLGEECETLLRTASQLRTGVETACH
jgi:formiminotetrahydrofolate cyclodeaminase